MDEISFVFEKEYNKSFITQIRFLDENLDNIKDGNFEDIFPFYILACTSNIENHFILFMSDFLNLKLYNSNDSKKINYIKNYLENKITRLTFKNYKEEYKLNFDVDISQYDNWESIDVLFKLRNKLIHGVNPFFDDGNYVNREYEDIWKFLIKEEIVKVEKGNIINFNNQTSDFFVYNTKHFLKFLYKKLEEKIEFAIFPKYSYIDNY